MKKKSGHIFYFFLLGSILSSACNSNNNQSVLSDSSYGNKAEIVFKDYEHNFGKVYEGEKVAYVFSFENGGDSDLVITSASTTCGCTVPKYNTNPIPPGKKGSLEVVFDTSGRNGIQTKTITVKSNSSKPVVILKITAEVIENINQ